MTVDDTTSAESSRLAAPESLLRVLREGELRIAGRLREASNATLFAEATLDGETLTCVYKPIAGERPLWDFPDGTLAGREVAAYTISEAIGWHVVPPTVMRAEGPFGPGMCQRWIDTLVDEPGEGDDSAAADDAAAEAALAGTSGLDGDGGGSAAGNADDGGEGDAGRPAGVPRVLALLPPGTEATGWLPIVDVAIGEGEEAVLAHRDDVLLARVAAFDVVINNADRKGGHLLPVPDHVYAIDHGVTFHVEDKLRTLLWGFAGRDLPGDVRATLTALVPRLAAGPLRETLRGLIADEEIDAAAARLDALLAAGTYPLPADDRHVIPWPPI